MKMNAIFNHTIHVVQIYTHKYFMFFFPTVSSEIKYIIRLNRLVQNNIFNYSMIAL